MRSLCVYTKHLISYVDGNTQFAVGSSELEVIYAIKSVPESLLLWSQNNCMKVNPDKFHLPLYRNIHQVDVYCNEKQNKLT